MPTGQEQLCVLVVEDDPDMAKLIAGTLLKDDHQVVTAVSAEEALSLLPYYTFHAAFLDHRLPGMEGLALGGYFSRNNPDMAVALVTGEAAAELRRESERLGITYIHKPFDLRDLRAVVDAYRERAQQRSERRLREAGADFHPRFSRPPDDIAAYLDLPKVPQRIADRLVLRIKELLRNISTVARYTERDRIAALVALLTARALGVDLPTESDGATLFEHFDRAMEKHGRRKEFE